MALNNTFSALQFVKRRPGTASADGLASASWIPNTDVYAVEDGLVIRVELAGMRREDLELTVEGNLLRISGYREDGCRMPGCKFILMEINYGAFESVIELPSGYDLSQARAAYQNGFLRIDIPAQSPSCDGGRTIPISSEED